MSRCHPSIEKGQVKSSQVIEPAECLVSLHLSFHGSWLFHLQPMVYSRVFQSWSARRSTENQVSQPTMSQSDSDKNINPSVDDRKRNQPSHHIHNHHSQQQSSSTATQIQYIMSTLHLVVPGQVIASTSSSSSLRSISLGLMVSTTLSDDSTPGDLVDSHVSNV